ncbi:hypothetical protein SCUP515_08818 [Seiridium cupressi]
MLFLPLLSLISSHGIAGTGLAAELSKRESNFNATCTWFIADNFTLTGSCTGLEVHPGRVWERDSELDLNKCIGYAGNGKLIWKENGNYWAGIVNEPMAQASYGCKRDWMPLGSLDMTCWIGGLSAKSFNINLSEGVSNKNGTLSCFETEGQNLGITQIY